MNHRKSDGMPIRVLDAVCSAGLAVFGFFLLLFAAIVSLLRHRKTRASDAPRRLLIVGYTPIEEAREKGVLGEDIDIWFNPASFFENVEIVIVTGRQEQERRLSERIFYREYGPAKRLSQHGFRYTARALGLIGAMFGVNAVARRTDVIQVNGPNASSVPALFARLMTGAPAAVFIEAFWEDVVQQQQAPAAIRRILPIWYRIVYRAFDAYYGAPSLYPDRYVAMGMARRKIRTFLNNVDAEAVQSNALRGTVSCAVLSARSPRFVIVGRLHQEKLVSDALEAFVSYAGRGHQGTLVVIGDGPEREALRSSVRERNLEERVIFTGALPGADVAAIVKASDIFVATYQGNALLEALALGCPALAYNNAPHRALALDCKAVTFVQDRDVAALCAAMIAYSQLDEFARSSLSQAAGSWARAKYNRKAMNEAALDPFMWCFRQLPLRNVAPDDR